MPSALERRLEKLEADAGVAAPVENDNDMPSLCALVCAELEAKLAGNKFCSNWRRQSVPLNRL
jgi:hypothetical protein